MLLDNLIKIHLKNITGKNKVSFLATEEGKDFLMEIIQQFEKYGWIIVNIMYINDEIGAYALSFHYEHKYYYWNVAVNNDYIRFSPGKLLLHHMLKENFTDNSVREFDLLRGEEEYKYRWTSLKRENYQITVINNSFYSRTIFKLRNIIHSLRKRYD